MKVAHACEGLGVDIEFHGPGPAVRQCMAAVRNSNYYEMGLLHPKAPVSHIPDLYLDFADDAAIMQGRVPVPQLPGLGVEINWDWVERNRTGMTVYEPD